MRMAADQLAGDGLDDAAEVERALLLRHAGMEHHLQQQVAEFVAKVIEVAPRDGICDLIGLLDRIGCDGGEILLQIPRAAAARRAQRRHDGDQVVNGARRVRRGRGIGQGTPVERNCPFLPDRCADHTSCHTPTQA